MKLKTTTQIAQMTNQPRSLIDEWCNAKPALMNIIEMGCQKALDSIPDGWTYECNADHKEVIHIFTHDNYCPDDDGNDSEHLVWGFDFIQCLNDVHDQEQEWRYLSAHRGIK